VTMPPAALHTSRLLCKAAPQLYVVQPLQRLSWLALLLLLLLCQCHHHLLLLRLCSIRWCCGAAKQTRCLLHRGSFRLYPESKAFLCEYGALPQATCITCPSSCRAKGITWQAGARAAPHISSHSLELRCCWCCCCCLLRAHASPSIAYCWAAAGLTYNVHQSLLQVTSRSCQATRCDLLDCSLPTANRCWRCCRQGTGGCYRSSRCCRCCRWRLRCSSRRHGCCCCCGGLCHC
jgi:hypothetical protein